MTALVSFAPLQSSRSNQPRSGVADHLSWDSSRALPPPPTSLPERCSSHRSFSAPPSTSSPASTPAPTSLPSLRSRSANSVIPFRPHRFARSRRFTPPFVPLARGSCPLLGWDSRACCIPLPILGFAAFLAEVRVFSAPHTGHLAMVDVLPVTRIPRPRSAVRTPRRIPPIRSRVVSPRPLPP